MLRKLLLPIILFFVFVSSARATNYCASAVLCYKLTEGSGTTTTDNSGNSNTGTFKSSGHPAWSSSTVPSYNVSGSAANSLSYASGDYVDSGTTTTLTNLPGSAWSLTMWVYATGDGDSNKGRFIDKNEWSMQFDSTGSHLIQLTIAFSGGTMTVASSTALGLSGWHFIAIRGNGSTTASNTHIYIDNTEVSYGVQTNASGSLSTDSTHVQIGNRQSDEARTFGGNIGPVMLFNSELTTTQLTEIYNYGPGGAPSSGNNGFARFL